MNIWILLAIFFAVSLLGCIIGFKKFVYFLSVGYGFSVTLLGIAYVVYGIISGSIDVICVIQCLLLAVYGLRLSIFLIVREVKNKTYRKVFKEVTKTEKPMPIFVLASIWISVGALYVLQTSGVFFRLYDIKNNGVDDLFSTTILPIIGIVITFIGLVLESISDKQKSDQKAKNPHMVATQGLFKFVRCPNYFGEIIFWTGVFVSSLGLLRNNVEQWIIVVIGYICIVYVMINGAQRLDKRQEKNYGTNEEYRKYADHTPIIIPLIPVYHIGLYKVEDIEAKKAKKSSKKS